MTIEIRETAQATILDIMENLISSPHHPEELRKVLAGLLRSGPPNVIINFSRIQMVNGDSWGVIVRFARDFRHHDRDIKLVGLTPGLQAHFGLLHFSEVLETYPTEEEAFASFTNRVSRVERNILWKMKT
jgi:anti-anti-sigma regulatory factor